MPSIRSGKGTRVPWKLETQVRNSIVTLPVFMAYCSVAASLRAWNRPHSNFIVTLRARDDFYHPVYAEAAEAFAAGIWKPREFTSYAYEWKDRSFRDEMEAHKNKRAIFIAPPDYNLDDDEGLFSDAVLDLEPRTRRHAEAALRRAGLPLSDRDVDLLLSEPWPRLVKAFQDRRHPMLALERLRTHSRVPATRARGRKTVGTDTCRHARIRTCAGMGNQSCERPRRLQGRYSPMERCRQWGLAFRTSRCRKDDVCKRARQFLPGADHLRFGF